MSCFEPPTADNALLGFMFAVLVAVSSVTLVMYWLLQPTMLVNAGGEAMTNSRVSAIIQRSPDVDIEASAIALARRENEKQGLRPLAVVEAAPPALVSVVAHASPPKPSPKKRVVRSEPRDLGWSFDRRSAWAFGLPAHERAPFGGFGSWFR